jgi:phosphopantothenoylcysteine decarboxylase
MNVLLGVTGSIAAKLTSRLETALYEAGHEIKVIVTKNAEYFDTVSYIYPVYDDLDEIVQYKQNQTVLHVDLAKWADVLLIAPCTANTLSKIRARIADNLLTCTALAYPKDKPFLIAPAMNTVMYENMQGSFLGYRTWDHILPQEKTLYCGDTGLGAMAEISDIVERVNRYNLAA